jgi:hypothetical protein
MWIHSFCRTIQYCVLHLLIFHLSWSNHVFPGALAFSTFWIQSFSLYQKIKLVVDWSTQPTLFARKIMILSTTLLTLNTMWHFGYRQRFVDLNNTIFCEITLYSPLKDNWRFGGSYLLHIQRRRISQTRNERENRWQALVLRPWRWRRYVPPKPQLTFNGVHGVISHRSENLRFSYRFTHQTIGRGGKTVQYGWGTH